MLSESRLPLEDKFAQQMINHLLNRRVQRRMMMFSCVAACISSGCPRMHGASSIVIGTIAYAPGIGVRINQVML